MIGRASNRAEVMALITQRGQALPAVTPTPQQRANLVALFASKFPGFVVDPSATLVEIVADLELHLYGIQDAERIRRTGK